MVSWRAICVLAGCLTVLSQTANAQSFGSRRNAGRGVKRGNDISGPQHAFEGRVGGFTLREIGASLLKTCDTNQDGIAAPSEVKIAMLNWFQHADTDTNGTLSQVELATALKQIFHEQPPPGFRPPPEELAMHNVFAGKLMTAVDTNKDGWMTSKKAIVFLDKSFPRWDSDKGGSLLAAEFESAFAQLFLLPES